MDSPTKGFSLGPSEPTANSRSESDESVSLDKRPLLGEPSGIEAPAEPISASQDSSPRCVPLDSGSHSSAQSVSGNLLCPICQDAPCNSRTACGHQFCEGCLGSWLREHLTCPLCRKVLKPLHITIYATNNESARELIVFNELTYTLTYGVRCRWTIQGVLCTGRLLQKYILATGAYEPCTSHCRECRGTVVIPPQAVRDLGSALRRKCNPIDCGFRLAEDLPSDEQLVQDFSLVSGSTRQPWTCVHWIILILVGFVLVVLYWLAITHL